MKKCFIIVLVVSLLFILTGCAKKVVYVDQNGKVIENAYGTKVSDYCQMREVCKKSHERIYVDTYTDVLYYCLEENYDYQLGITPIMKADGTCLTYTEWKSRGANYEF
jgi:hypothetical protein